MKKDKMYCTACRKFTEHRSYCEERTIDYMGFPVDYTEEGWICTHCGEEQQTVEQFDKAMAEIKETHYILKKG